MSLPPEMMHTYAENIWHRFPEVFLSLGSPAVDECFEPSHSGRWHRRVVDSPEGKLVEVFLPRKGTRGKTAIQEQEPNKLAKGRDVGAKDALRAMASGHSARGGLQATHQASAQSREAVEAEHETMQKLRQLYKRLGHLRRSLPERVSRELRVTLGLPDCTSSGSSPRFSTSSSIVSSLAERRGKCITPINTALCWRASRARMARIGELHLGPQGADRSSLGGGDAWTLPGEGERGWQTDDAHNGLAHIASGCTAAGAGDCTSHFVDRTEEVAPTPLAENSPEARTQNVGRKKQHLKYFEQPVVDSPGAKIQRMARQRRQAAAVSMIAPSEAPRLN